MSILNKIKDILHIEHHPHLTTRIVKVETDEYLVQIWDTEPLGIIHHWQNTAVRLNKYVEIRSKSLDYAIEEKQKLDEEVQKYLHCNVVKEVIA
jgi:hypothetical protein